jgi:acetolactate synthase regulatory subunit
LRANKSQKVVLQFNAEQQQEGLVRIELVVSYRCATLNEQLSKFIDVNFIAPLLEKNASVQSFEDMF